MECFHIEERGCFATPALRRENLMKGDVILIYPRTDSFHEPLPVFEFPKANGLRLWVLPFCLKSRMLSVPVNAEFADAFRVGTHLTMSPGIGVPRQQHDGNLRS